MAMIEYVAQAKFTLSVLNNTSLSGGVDVRPGDTIHYDGYNVVFGHIQDVSKSLQAAINEGWLIPVEEAEAALSGEAPAVQEQPAQKIPDQQQLLGTARVPATPEGAQKSRRIVSSEATSATRGRQVFRQEEHVVKRTNYGKVDTPNNSTANIGRLPKLAVTMENDTSRVVGTVSNREQRILGKNQQGDKVISSKRVVASHKNIDLDDQKAVTAAQGIVLPSRRSVPAKFEATEVTPGVNTSDAKVYRDLGLNHQPTAEELAKAHAEALTVEQANAIHEERIKVANTMKETAPSEEGPVKISKIDEDIGEVPLPEVSQKIHSSTPKLAQDINPEGIPEAPSAAIVEDIVDEEQVDLDDMMSVTEEQLAEEEAPALELPEDAEETDSQTSSILQESMEGLMIDGENWMAAHYSRKIELLEKVTSISVLEEIISSFKTYYKVRDAAKERLEVLAQYS